MNRRIQFSFFIILCVLLIAILGSILIGTRDIAIGDILSAFQGDSQDALVISILEKRIIRTVLGLITGVALGISGCLMQSITRNPIADPSILGVNAGASLFVVSGIAFVGLHTPWQYILFALAGAFTAALLVFGIASFSSRTSYTKASPIRLALAGAAVSTACSSLISTIMLPRTNVMQTFRFWQVGSIASGNWSSIFTILPIVVLVVIFSFLLAPSLNIMALGDDAAIGLGINVKRIRTLAAICGVILCACVTAICGPIGFVGLIIPHFVRLIGKNDMSKEFVFSALGGAMLLLVGDIIGRIISRPSEIEVGIVTALIGAPIFILIVQNVKANNT
ncbi:MAG: iron ABC transporter permease [Solobacterium sp.]|nr:iron ABC transporter permease [Solobacterium sp.]